MKRKILIGGFGLLLMAGSVVCLVISQAKAASEEAASEKVISQEDPASVYSKQGNDFLADGSYNKAIESYKESLNCRDSAYTRRQLGIAYNFIGEYENAEISFKKAISMSPGAIQLYSDLSYLYAKQGRYDDVIATCKTGLKLKPDYILLLNNLADAYMNKGLYDDAITVIEKALAIDSTLAIAHSTYAEICEKKGDYEMALQEFEKIKNDPEYGNYALTKISEIKKIYKK